MRPGKHDKADVINYDEFNQLIDHTDFHHDPPPLDVIPQDENNNQAEETLMGMEYDFDTESPSEEYDEDEDEELNEDDEYDKTLAMELAEDQDEEDYNEDYNIGDLEYEDEGEDYEGDLKADARNNQKAHHKEQRI